MNSNLFERKQFLNNSWTNSNSTEYFSRYDNENNVVVTVNLMRATANESDDFNQFLIDNFSKSDQSIIIDLSSCNFIDSTFLSTIVSFNKKHSNEVKLVVTDTRQFLIFKITKLDTIFNIYSNLDQALAA